MSKPPQPPPLIGMENLGNTCFINTCIQILAHTPEMNKCLQELPERVLSAHEPDKIICVEWRRLLHDYLAQTTNATISPKKFIHTIQKISVVKNKELFTGWTQNDFAEFLYFMVECFHNTLAHPVDLQIKGNVANKMDKMAIQCYKHLQSIYSKEYSTIMHRFYGVYVNEIWSLDKKRRHSTKPESFFILDMEIPIQQHPHNLEVSTGLFQYSSKITKNKSTNTITLYDCLDHFTKDEIMEGDCAWYNEKTKQKEDIVKKIAFWSLPNVLCITIKRSINEVQKNVCLVDFPLCGLDLCPYVCGYGKDKYKNYELYAVCNHYGNNHNGHYNAFIKKGGQNGGGQWFCYDDENVFAITAAEQVITPFAYCLFYRNGGE